MKFAVAAVAAALPLLAQQARIKIDTDRTISEVHPHVFGNFAEHLGRVIYGGMYDEGNPLSDSDGFRTDVMKAVRDLGVTLLRYPGGNFVSGYNWRDGIGPKANRPVRADYAWGDVESNRFGTDEFLRYCEKIGAEPYLCINAGLGTVDEARQWVEYTNESRNTALADLRRKNGRDKPWAVKYWGLGNELDGPWQIGHKNAEDYTKFAREAAKAMRWSDRSIKLIASGSSNYNANADWIGWNRTVLDGLRDHIDYLSLHMYIGNRDSNFERFLGASAQDLDHRIEITKGLIASARSGRPNARPIDIAFDEWNVWYRARGGSGIQRLEEIYNFEDALAMGMFLNSFIRHADVIKMANLAQLVNGIAPIFTSKQGLFLQPIYFPIAEYAKQKGQTALDVLVTAPTYKLEGRPEPVSYLDVSSTYNAGTRTVFLNVLNRSEKNAIETKIDNSEGKLAASAEVWEMNHADLKAVHTFGKDDVVRPKTRTAQLAGGKYTFPAHSLTILKLKLQ